MGRLLVSLAVVLALGACSNKEFEEQVWKCMEDISAMHAMLGNYEPESVMRHRCERYVGERLS